MFQQSNLHINCFITITLMIIKLQNDCAIQLIMTDNAYRKDNFFGRTSKDICAIISDRYDANLFINDNFDPKKWENIKPIKTFISEECQFIVGDRAVTNIFNHFCGLDKALKIPAALAAHSYFQDCVRTCDLIDD